jgi:N-acetylglucosamine malate deacetylase 1
MKFTSVPKNFKSYFPSPKLTPKIRLPLKILILSPHPDDECITSALALRLQHENHAQITNVAVTLGSLESRKQARKNELINACKVLNIKTIFCSEDWDKKKIEIKNIIEDLQPALILVPHLKDHHPTHIKTGKILKELIPHLKIKNLLIAHTEFWHPMHNPNLLIEVPDKILDLQIKALKKHKGEITRNPYHLRLQAWMMDAVRRGSETIGNAGSPTVKMTYGVIYRLELFILGRRKKLKECPSFLYAKDDIGSYFSRLLEPAFSSKTNKKLE